MCFGSTVEQIVALSSGLQGWQKLNVETTLSHKFLEKLSRNFQVSRGNHVINQSFSKVSRETSEKLPSNFLSEPGAAKVELGAGRSAAGSEKLPRNCLLEPGAAEAELRRSSEGTPAAANASATA